MAALARAGVTIALCAIALAGSSPADEESLAARFEREAPESWARLEESAGHLEMQLVQRLVRPEPDIGQSVLDMTIKVSGRQALRTIHYRQLPRQSAAVGTRHVYGRNGKYAFRLRKNAEDRPWFVRYQGDRHALDHEFRNMDALTRFATIVVDRNLVSWSTQPEFSVKSVEWVERPAGKLVAVSFECGQSPQARYWIHDGVVYLNPERLWAIQEFEIVATNGRGTEEYVRQRNEFRDDAGPMPSLKSAQMTADTEVGRVQYFFDFTRFEHRQIPPEELTLAAFGLPEPAPPGPGAAVQVEAAVHHLGAVPSRSEHPLSFALHNSGTGALQILGASSGCGKAGCIDLRFDEPRTIGPGETSQIEVTYRAGPPGPFSRTFEVYTDAPGQSQIELTVTGQSLPTGQPPPLGDEPDDE